MNLVDYIYGQEVNPVVTVYRVPERCGPDFGPVIYLAHTRNVRFCQINTIDGETVKFLHSTELARFTDSSGKTLVSFGRPQTYSHYNLYPLFCYLQGND